MAHFCRVAHRETLVRKSAVRLALSRDRGMVLLLVLWILVLLTVLAASYVQSASTEGLQARYMLNTTQARYAAEAGLHRAVYELNNQTLDMRWKGDGRPYEMQFDDADLTIEIVDDNGKLDINSVDVNLWKAVFVRLGQEPLRAEALAAAILDYRDADELKTPNGAEKTDYLAAGLDYGPRNQSFVAISELQQVIGMDFALFERLEPMLTMNSGSGVPNLAYAQLDVMAAVLASQGQIVSDEVLQAVIQLRQTALSGQPVVLPNGTALGVPGSGSNYTITVTSVLKRGGKAVLQASVQLGGGTVAGRPFRTSRWREGQSN
jgi:general secretion pathway protein K